MKIKLDSKNHTAISKALANVNGTALSFTISCLSELQRVVTLTEKALINLPKASHVEVQVSYCPAGPSTNSYNYDAISTKVKLMRFASGWFLVGASKIMLKPKTKESLRIAVTQEQLNAIAAQSIKPFTLLP